MGEMVFKICGDKVSSKSIPADVLGRILLRTQGLVYDVVDHRWYPQGKKKPSSQEYKKIFRIAITDIRDGSAEIVLGSMGISQDTVFPEEQFFSNVGREVNDVLDVLESGIENIEEDNYGFYNKISRHIRDMTYSDDYEISFRSEINKNMSWHNLKNEKIKRTMDELDEKLIDERAEIVKGVIVRIKRDGNDRYFTVKTDEGKIIKASLDDISITEIGDYFLELQPVVIKGEIETKGRRKAFAEIDSIKKMEKFEYSYEGFSKKIMVTPDFQHIDGKDYWIANCDELNLNGFGDTLNDSIDSLIESIEVACDIYLDETDGNLAMDARKFKRILLSYI